MHVYVRTMQHTAGTFPPLLCLKHKSRENVHWFLAERALPFTRSCFCRKQGLPPSRYRECKARSVNWITESSSQCPPCLCPNPPGLNDSLADARLGSIGFSGCRERPCAASSVLACALRDETVQRLPQRAGPGRGVPTTGVAQRPCQAQPGCWAEAWHDRSGGTSDHQGWGWGGEAGRAGDEGSPQRQMPPPQPHRCARAQTQGAGNEPRNVAPCNVTKAHAGLGGDFHGTPARWQPRLYFPSEVSDFEHRRVTESSKCHGSFARDFFPPSFTHQQHKQKIFAFMMPHNTVRR